MESVKLSSTQAAAAPGLAEPPAEALQAASKEISPADDREPLTSVKRELTQAAAAPMLQQTEGSTTEGGSAVPAPSPIPGLGEPLTEAPGAPEGDMREPLSSVKRELTQAAAAPHIAQVIEEGTPAGGEVQVGRLARRRAS